MELSSSAKSNTLLLPVERASDEIIGAQAVEGALESDFPKLLEDVTRRTQPTSESPDEQRQSLSVSPEKVTRQNISAVVEASDAPAVAEKNQLTTQPDTSKSPIGIELVDALPHSAKPRVKDIDLSEQGDPSLMSAVVDSQKPTESVSKVTDLLDGRLRKLSGDQTLVENTLLPNADSHQSQGLRNHKSIDEAVTPTLTMALANQPPKTGFSQSAAFEVTDDGVLNQRVNVAQQSAALPNGKALLNPMEVANSEMNSKPAVLRDTVFSQHSEQRIRSAGTHMDRPLTGNILKAMPLESTAGQSSLLTTAIQEQSREVARIASLQQAVTTDRPSDISLALSSAPSGAMNELSREVSAKRVAAGVSTLVSEKTTGSVTQATQMMSAGIVDDDATQKPTQWSSLLNQSSGKESGVTPVGVENPVVTASTTASDDKKGIVLRAVSADVQDAVVANRDTATVGTRSDSHSAATLPPISPAETARVDKAVALTTPLPMISEGAELPNKLGQQIRFMTENGVQSVVLRVNPAELGPVKIEVAMANEQLAVNITASQPLAREMLESALPRLREALNLQNGDQVDVNVSQQNREGGQTQHEQQAQQRQRQYEPSRENVIEVKVKAETAYPDAVINSRPDSHIDAYA